MKDSAPPFHIPAFDDTAELLLESGDWIALRQEFDDRPKLSANPCDLLSESPQVSVGNRRLVVARSGRILLRAELHNHDHLLSVAEARQRMITAADDQSFKASTDQIDGVLNETNLCWAAMSERFEWQTRTSVAGFACDLKARLIDEGVHVIATLPRVETQDTATSKTAIASYLLSAQDQLRFVSFQWHDDLLSAHSFAVGDRWALELTDSVHAVMEACRLVSDHARALCHRELAEAYQQMTAGSHGV